MWLSLSWLVLSWLLSSVFSMTCPLRLRLIDWKLRMLFCMTRCPWTINSTNYYEIWIFLETSWLEDILSDKNKTIVLFRFRWEPMVSVSVNRKRLAPRSFEERSWGLEHANLVARRLNGLRRQRLSIRTSMLSAPYTRFCNYHVPRMYERHRRETIQLPIVSSVIVKLSTAPPNNDTCT